MYILRCMNLNASALLETRTKTSIDKKLEGKKLNFWCKEDQRYIFIYIFDL